MEVTLSTLFKSRIGKQKKREKDKSKGKEKAKRTKCE